MFNNIEAQTKLEKTLPDVIVKSWTVYHDLYLFCVEYPDPEEKDWDPFFSVDPLTEEVRDFSVLTDGDISEIVDLEWHDI